MRAPVSLFVSVPLFTYISSFMHKMGKVPWRCLKVSKSIYCILSSLTRGHMYLTLSVNVIWKVPVKKKWLIQTDNPCVDEVIGLTDCIKFLFPWLKDLLNSCSATLQIWIQTLTENSLFKLKQRIMQTSHLIVTDLDFVNIHIILILTVLHISQGC